MRKKRHPPRFVYDGADTETNNPADDIEETDPEVLDDDSPPPAGANDDVEPPALPARMMRSSSVIQVSRTFKPGAKH